MKWLVIHSEDESTPEIRVPGDFKPVLIREYVGKKGEEVFSKDYLIDQDECTHDHDIRHCPDCGGNHAEQNECEATNGKMD